MAPARAPEHDLISMPDNVSYVHYDVYLAGGEPLSCAICRPIAPRSSPRRETWRSGRLCEGHRRDLRPYARVDAARYVRARVRAARDARRRLPRRSDHRWRAQAHVAEWPGESAPRRVIACAGITTEMGSTALAQICQTHQQQSYFRVARCSWAPCRVGGCGIRALIDAPDFGRLCCFRGLVEGERG
jgi:hypothetical protein